MDVITWLADAARNSSDWLRRIADPGVWILAVFAVWTAASLLAGRLLALKVPTGWMQRRARAQQNTLFEGKGFIPSGVILVLLGVAGWTWAGTTGAGATFSWIAALGALVDLLGVLVLAAGLALRLRVQVKVVAPNGVTNPVHSSYVAARMAALGSSRPRGLLFPHGTDTAKLPEDALTIADTAPSKLAASILSLLRILTSVIPWKADIYLVDKQTAAVTLRRNGSQDDSALLSTATLLPADSTASDPDSDRALLTAAAAFILFRLSRAYPKLGEGLAGAEQWQSVASQVLATTPPWRDEPKTSAELFARAVDLDPRNLAAWLGFLTKSIGSYGSLPTLNRGIPRLRRVLQELNSREGLELPDRPDPNARRGPLPEEALRIRLLRTLTILTNNKRLLLQDDPCQQRDEARKSMIYATQLMEAVQSASTSERGWSHLNEYAKRMQPLAASLYVHVWKLQSPVPEKDGWLALAHTWKPAKPRQTALGTLRYHYDEACAKLEVDGKQGTDSALDHLDLALALGELRDGAASDPSFKQLRLDQDVQFSSLMDSTPRLAALTVLSKHSGKLADVGIRFASDLLSRNGADGDASLALTLGVPAATIAWMRDVCRLADSCPDALMAVDWTNLLTEVGIDSPQALHRLVTDDQFFNSRYRRLVRAADPSSIEAPQQEDLQRWDLRLAAATSSANMPS